MAKQIGDWHMNLADSIKMIKLRQLGCHFYAKTWNLVKKKFSMHVLCKYRSKKSHVSFHLKYSSQIKLLNVPALPFMLRLATSRNKMATNIKVQSHLLTLFNLKEDMFCCIVTSFCNIRDAIIKQTKKLSKTSKSLSQCDCALIFKVFARSHWKLHNQETAKSTWANVSAFFFMPLSALILVLSCWVLC